MLCDRHITFVKRVSAHHVTFYIPGEGVTEAEARFLIPVLFQNQHNRPPHLLGGLSACKTCIACARRFDGVGGPGLCRRDCGVLMLDMVVSPIDVGDVEALRKSFASGCCFESWRPSREGLNVLPSFVTG